MAATVPIVDAGFLVSLLNRRDGHHKWAAALAAQYPPPWQSCEAVVSEAFFLLGRQGQAALAKLLERGALHCAFAFQKERDAVLALMRKYSDVPMSLADACLVRMTEILPAPILLTTDGDFHIYRRSNRRVVPCKMPF